MFVGKEYMEKTFPCFKKPLACFAKKKAQQKMEVSTKVLQGSSENLELSLCRDAIAQTGFVELFLRTH